MTTSPTVELKAADVVSVIADLRQCHDQRISCAAATPMGDAAYVELVTAPAPLIASAAALIECLSAEREGTDFLRFLASYNDGTPAQEVAKRWPKWSREFGQFLRGTIGKSWLADEARAALSTQGEPLQLADRTGGWEDAEQLAYWRRGHAIIEGRLTKAVAAKHEDAPFPMDAQEAAAWHYAQANAYQDALEMMGVPECAAPTPAKGGERE
jgi:hypothetical protein